MCASIRSIVITLILKPTFKVVTKVLYLGFFYDILNALKFLKKVKSVTYKISQASYSRNLVRIWHLVIKIKCDKYFQLFYHRKG